MKLLIYRAWPFLIVVAAIFGWLAGIQFGCQTQLLDITACTTAYHNAFTSYFPVVSFITGIILAIQHGWDLQITGAMTATALVCGLLVGSYTALTSQTSGPIAIAMGYTVGYLVVFLFGLGSGLLFRWATNRK